MSMIFGIVFVVAVCAAVAIAAVGQTIISVVEAKAKEKRPEA